MLVSDFCRMLAKGGFEYIKGECAEITYWFRIYGNSVYCFQVCDFSNGVSISENDLLTSQQRIRNGFYVKGYGNIESMAVVFAYDIVAAKYLFAYDMAHWFVDLNERKLIIYETQPEDFIGWRRNIELFLEQQEAVKTVPGKFFLRNLLTVNAVIVIVNIIVFLITEFKGNTLDAYYMYKCGAIFGPAIKENHEFYRIFTAMFLHFGSGHLSSNMIVLFLLGDNLERALGKIKYVILYILSGLLAGSCSVIYNIWQDNNTVCAGASGAIFGVIGALLYVVLANNGRLEDLTGLRLIILIAYVLYTGFTSPGIDNAAHIGGLIAGFLLGIILYRKNGIKKEMSA